MVTDFFGENVFNLSVMKERLPEEIFKSLEHTIKDGTPLDPGVAEVVAENMKIWAIEKGATHYTHWFQPLTGITAEKHDAFITPAEDGKIIMEFSGKELIKGEPDASSFPSGGLRTTFEARGYTSWDPTAFAFIKDSSLCIPTTFYSYTGDVLDIKTPLLRSMEAVNKEALRVLKFFDSDATRVISYVGPEQEYFLVDKELYEKRKDLMLTGRTLFGAMPAKGQELDDHYFGSIKERISSYMKELDKELWKLGVLSKTKHNEAAPAQHELAPIFSIANEASDHNQITMEVMKKVAERHGLVCLLHEKPFEGINGSGKHDNWSLGTNTGENLFKPGKKPLENKRFLIFLSAVIKAVDEYGALLRASVATAGNDHRLGGNEAPPAIISIFLGDDIQAVVDAIKEGRTSLERASSVLETGVGANPVIKKDRTDRNRTSPFAFTGNKFEFRSPGSAQSVAGVNVALNTMVAEALSQFAERLENAKNPEEEIMNIIVDTINKHERIVFNGNNYSEEWVSEAQMRGIPNLRTTVDALPVFVWDEIIELFGKHNIFTENECRSRYEVFVEDYSKALHIEALTMIEMSRQEILPSCIEYTNVVAKSLRQKKELGIKAPNEKKLLENISAYTEKLILAGDKIEELIGKTSGYEGIELAKFYKDNIVPAMAELRASADKLELLVGKKYWPLPTYCDLLYRI